MENAMIESILENMQFLTPSVTSQVQGTQKGSKVNNFPRKWNKKLKFGICTNFDMQNAINEFKCENFQNLSPTCAVTNPTVPKRVKSI